jgi:multiple sugar transport system substrate-binding protein
MSTSRVTSAWSHQNQRHLNRRQFGASLFGAGALIAAGRLPGNHLARAQGVSGTITVGYESGNELIAGLVDQAIQALKAANPGAEIDVKVGAAGNYLTQLVLALASGTAPDVFFTSGIGIAEFSEPGLIERLDTYVAEWEDWAQYPENIKTAITYRDSIWALPYAIDTHFLYYRKDLFEAAGLPREWQPTTTDEILEAARAIKGLGNDIIPYGLYAGANGGNSTAVRGFLPQLYAHGGWLTDDSGKWVIESCPIRDTLAYYETAYQVDATVPQDAMTAPDPPGMLREAVLAGELGILYDGSWVYGGWAADDLETTMSEIGFALHPRADGGEPFAVGAIGNSWYINARCQNKPLAWEFLKAANASELQVQFNSQDPHIPPRADAAADPVFQSNPFFQAMVASEAALVTAQPDSAFRQLIGVIQNATGIVATGDVTADEATTRYSEEMARILGEENVVRQPCG